MLNYKNVNTTIEKCRESADIQKQISNDGNEFCHRFIFQGILLNKDGHKQSSSLYVPSSNQSCNPHPEDGIKVSLVFYLKSIAHEVSAALGLPILKQNQKNFAQV